MSFPRSSFSTDLVLTNENRCQAVENYGLCADILGIFSAQIHRQDFHALEELLLWSQTRGLNCLHPGIHRRCLYFITTGRRRTLRDIRDEMFYLIRFFL